MGQMRVRYRAVVQHITLTMCIPAVCRNFLRDSTSDSSCSQNTTATKLTEIITNVPVSSMHPGLIYASMCVSGVSMHEILCFIQTLSLICPRNRMVRVVPSVVVRSKAQSPSLSIPLTHEMRAPSAFTWTSTAAPCWSWTTMKTERTAWS